MQISQQTIRTAIEYLEEQGDLYRTISYGKFDYFCQLNNSVIYCIILLRRSCFGDIQYRLENL